MERWPIISVDIFVSYMPPLLLSPCFELVRAHRTKTHTHTHERADGKHNNKIAQHTYGIWRIVHNQNNSNNKMEKSKANVVEKKCVSVCIETCEPKVMQSLFHASAKCALSHSASALSFNAANAYCALIALNAFYIEFYCSRCCSCYC